MAEVIADLERCMGKRAGAGQTRWPNSQRQR